MTESNDGTSRRGAGGGARPGGVDSFTATEAYAERFRGRIGRWFLDVQDHSLCRALEPSPEAMHVLDVGGVHAQLAPALVDRGHRVTVAGTRASSSHRVLRSAGAGAVSFVAARLASLPFPDASFDAVVSFRMLAHVEDWSAFLAELCRVAVGPVVVDYPSRRSLNVAARPLFGIKRLVEGDSTRPFRLLRPSGVAEVFERHGYRVTREIGEFFWPMALHRLHRRRRWAERLEAPLRAAGLTDRLGSPMVVRADPSGSGPQRHSSTSVRSSRS